MDTFGLGLVLNFTDNASAGMQKASQSFQQMSGLASQLTKSGEKSVQSLTMLSYGMNQLGTQMVQTGKNITGIFVGFGKEMTNVGSTLFAARNQLGMLYGSAEAGEAVINRVKDFSKKSVFEFEDLLASVLRMKSVQIEAFDEVTTSSGKSTQNLLQYAGDLAAFNPKMRNVYGTGIQAAMGSIIEYIAEGNAISMKRGAGLDITAILGEDKGKTIEERTLQIANLLEKLNMVGAVKSLEGTAGQQLSNLSDVIFNLKAAISDNGVFETYTRLVNQFSSAIFNIPQEKLDKLALTIGEGLVSLMEPLSELITKATEFITWLVDYINENPDTVKMIAKITAIAGALLLLGGTFLKLSSSAILIGLAFSRMAGIGSAVGLFRGIGGGAVTLLAKMLPLAGVATIIYTAWKGNLFGIRDLLETTFTDFGEKMSLIWGGISDNTMDEDQLTRARELGVLPFIESILDLKYNFGQFLTGLQEGADGALTSLQNLFNLTVEGGEGKTISLFDKLAGFIDSFTGPDKKEQWTEAGRSVGSIAVQAMVAFGVLKGFTSLIGLLSPVFSFMHSGMGIFLALSVGAFAFVTSEMEKDPNFAIGIFAGIEKIKSGFTDIRQGAKNLFAALADGKITEEEWGTIKSDFESGFTKVVSGLGEILMLSLKQGIMSFNAWIGKDGQAFITQISTEIGKMFSSINWGEVISGFMRAIVGFIDGATGGTYLTDLFFPEPTLIGSDNGYDNEGNWLRAPDYFKEDFLKSGRLETAIAYFGDEAVNSFFDKLAYRYEDDGKGGLRSYDDNPIFNWFFGGEEPDLPYYLDPNNNKSSGVTNEPLIVDTPPSVETTPPAKVPPVVIPAVENPQGIIVPSPPASVLWGPEGVPALDWFLSENKPLFTTPPSKETTPSGSPYSILPDDFAYMMSVSENLKASLPEVASASSTTTTSVEGDFRSVSEILEGVKTNIESIGTALDTMDKRYDIDIYLNVKTPEGAPANVSVDRLVQEGMGDFGPDYAAPHAVGGIFTKPTLLRSNSGRAHLVGEGSGHEAILPLDALWGQMDSKIKEASTNSTSIVFSEGSIVLQVSKATPEEMQKAARELMQYIEREQRLRSMAQRGVR